MNESYIDSLFSPEKKEDKVQKDGQDKDKAKENVEKEKYNDRDRRDRRDNDNYNDRDRRDRRDNDNDNNRRDRMDDNDNNRRDRKDRGENKRPNFFEDLLVRDKQNPVGNKKEQVAADPFKELAREQDALELHFSSFSGTDIPFFDAWIQALRSFKLKAPNDKFVRVDTKLLYDKVQELYIMYQFQFELASTAIKDKQPYEVFAESYNIEYPEYVKRKWLSFIGKIGTDHGVEHYLSELLVPTDAHDRALSKLPNYSSIDFSLRGIRNPDVKKVVHMINWYRTQGANWSNLTQQLLTEFTQFMQGLSQTNVRNKPMFDQLTRFSVDPKVSVTLRSLSKRLATNDSISRSLQTNLNTMYKGGGF